MASDDLKDVTDKLADTKVDEKYELSFKGKGLKLNKPEDGKKLEKITFSKGLKSIFQRYWIIRAVSECRY